MNMLLILADAAPSNDEMFGWFIFFGFMFLLFLIARLFGPGEVQQVAETVLPAPGATVKNWMWAIAIIFGVYIVGRVFASN